MLESRNPALRRVAPPGGHWSPSVDQEHVDAEFNALASGLVRDRMTIEGTVYKTLALLALTALTTFAVWVWADGEPVGLPLAGLAFFPLIAIGVLTGFKPHLARVTGPLYALIAGAFIGVLTLALAATLGTDLATLPMQAAMATLVVSGSMLVAYRTGLIRATPRLRKVVVTAAIAIAAFYAVNIVMSWFGSPMGLIWGGGLLPILLSVAFIGVASLMLVLDFDLVEQLAGNAEKRMEWYGAFALTTTLIWLYVEMLRLLALLQRD
ncbi:MAG TPA: Bax inhibitor-1/YccA family protein [Egibacteraceae bacterium]|nr:Bax inhibitor-1/YccA family protein [Egibacteraceae bacterium]